MLGLGCVVVVVVVVAMPTLSYLGRVENSPALEVPGETHRMHPHVDAQSPYLAQLSLEEEVA